MSVVLGALLLFISDGFAAPAPLRFSIADSWAMPMVQIEAEQPTQGILHDLMLSLTRHIGYPAQFLVLPRARIQGAMERGEIDVRCYVAPSWLTAPSNGLWSAPLILQRELLVSNLPSRHIEPADLPAQSIIGTVLGYRYPTLEPLFASGHLIRDDARSQEQVLHKLLAERYHYAVSNDWVLDSYNQHLPAAEKLHTVGVVQEHYVGCLVRNDPALPTRQILRTLEQMKDSGEIDEIIKLYTGQSP